MADYLIFGYFACLCCVVLPCVAWRNCVINFTVFLCIIFMQMFYRVMKAIYQFAANLLSYIPVKYYWNRSTSDLVIAKSRRVNFFWNTVYYCCCCGNCCCVARLIWSADIECSQLLRRRRGCCVLGIVITWLAFELISLIIRTTKIIGAQG